VTRGFVAGTQLDPLLEPQPAIAAGIEARGCRPAAVRFGRELAAAAQVASSR